MKHNNLSVRWRTLFFAAGLAMPGSLSMITTSFAQSSASCRAYAEDYAERYSAGSAWGNAFRVGGRRSAASSRALARDSGFGTCCRRFCERFTKGFFLGVIERCFQDGTPGVLNSLEHFVGGHFLDQHEKRGVTGLEVFRKLLHEGVIDAIVRQRPAECSGCCAQRDANDGIQEEDTYQQSPKAAGGRAYGRCVDQLIQLYRAGFCFYGDHGIAELDQVLLLHIQ